EAWGVAVSDESRPADQDGLADRDRVGCPSERKRVGPTRATRGTGRVEDTQLKLADRDDRYCYVVGQLTERPLSLARDKDRRIEQPGAGRGQSSSRVCPASSSRSRVSPGSAARSLNWSRSCSPESHRARRPWGTMSATGSPRTVSVTRSPAWTASIT